MLFKLQLNFQLNNTLILNTSLILNAILLNIYFANFQYFQSTYRSRQGAVIQAGDRCPVPGASGRKIQM